MVGHQKAAAKRANDLYLFTHLQIAQIVAGHATHRMAVVILDHALHRQRQIVVAGPLAVARAGNRILARHMGLAIGIRPGRNNANRLAFQHRERHGTEVQHDVVCLVVKACFRAVEIAHHGGRNRALGPMQIGVRVGRRPGRCACTKTGCAKHLGLSHGAAAAGAGRNARSGGNHGLCLAQILHIAAALLALCGGQNIVGKFGRQALPAQLLIHAIGAHQRYLAPVVDRAGGAG